MSHDYSQRIYERQLLRAAALSPVDSTATARAGDIQAGAGASKLTASSSPADAAKRGAIRLMLDFARGRKVLRELGN